MIVHIVMFKFKEENKAKCLGEAKYKLESLEKSIKELRSMEVGINFSEGERAFDMSIYTTFETLEDLKTYAVHKAHLEVVTYIKNVASESKVVDYVLE